MAAPFDVAIRNKRPAPPSEAGSDRTVTDDTTEAAQEDHPPDPQPPGTWADTVEVRHKKQKRDDDERSESEVACEKSPEENQVFASSSAREWDFLKELNRENKAFPGKASGVHKVAAPGSDSDETEVADGGDEGPDEAAFSQAPEVVEVVEYRGEEYTTANKRFKAKRLSEFYTRTETYLEHYLDDTLCPRWANGDRKEEMDWNIELINRLTDLQFPCNDCAEFNALLRTEVEQRRTSIYAPLPQVQKSEVHRVLDRLKAKKARQAREQDAEEP